MTGRERGSQTHAKFERKQRQRYRLRKKYVTRLDATRRHCPEIGGTSCCNSGRKNNSGPGTNGETRGDTARRGGKKRSRARGVGVERRTARRRQTHASGPTRKRPSQQLPDSRLGTTMLPRFHRSSASTRSTVVVAAAAAGISARHAETVAEDTTEDKRGEERASRRGGRRVRDARSEKISKALRDTLQGQVARTLSKLKRDTFVGKFLRLARRRVAEADERATNTRYALEFLSLLVLPLLVISRATSLRLSHCWSSNQLQRLAVNGIR